jgi:DNA-damage-inducible protein D
MDNQIAVFEKKPIRQVQHNGETYFSVIDIIEALTDSKNPNRYWSDLKRRSEKETGQSYAFCVSLKLKGTDGKMYNSDCANTEGVLRIIMAVPSPKAEPMRMWLAATGKQELDEIADPELGFERMRELYQAKGYSEEWIKQRLQSIDTRKKLTDEWKKRGVKEGQEYSILTATIAKGTFGLNPTEHKALKGIEKENLRDHMTDLELIFTALGEAATRIYTENDDAQGFEDNHDAAIKGGNAAGKARRNFEEDTKRQVVSPTNFLKNGEEQKKID